MVGKGWSGCSKGKVWLWRAVRTCLKLHELRAFYMLGASLKIMKQCFSLIYWFNSQLSRHWRWCYIKTLKLVTNLLEKLTVHHIFNSLKNAVYGLSWNKHSRFSVEIQSFTSVHSFKRRLTHCENGGVLEVQLRLNALALTCKTCLSALMCKNI